jgi:CO/xanthine dehydrogenase Mo-binding subunit
LASSNVDTGKFLALHGAAVRSILFVYRCMPSMDTSTAGKRSNVQMEIDAGSIIDPDGAMAQAQGGTLWGLIMALYEGTEFVNGHVKDLNLDTNTPLRMSDVPDMDIVFVESAEVPVGLGEPPTTVVAPAIGNAIFAAVGARIRHLPIRATDLRLTLEQARQSRAG